MVQNVSFAKGFPIVNSGPGVFLAVPNLGRNVCNLTQSLVFWYLRALMIGVRLPYPPYMPFMKPLDAARNMVVKEFLELDYEYLWWIDEDIVPPLNAFESMLSTLETRPEIDALGAVCFSMKEHNGDYFPFPVTLRRDKEGNLKTYHGRGIEEVDAVGGACVMVRRKVYENLLRPYEYHYHKDGTRKLDCDFDVWIKAKKSGFSLYADFDILCDHLRVCSIMGVQNLLAKIKREGNA